jgi:hypothetical protein
MFDVSLTVSAPWYIHYRKLQAMFREDPQVTVKFDQDNYEVKLYVDDADKAEALGKILRNSIDYGTITLKVTVIPPNYTNINIRNLYEKALEGNGAVHDYFTNPNLGKHYVIFKNEVIQYFSDDLSKANSVTSTLYENIAEDIFIDRAEMGYSTELGENVIKD